MMEQIYVVEDDEKLCGELCTLLEKNGYACIAAKQFDNVVEDIRMQNPDLVLLDIHLPVYDGFYICKELRRQSDVPIIVVTSSTSDMDELMSLNLGADDFITKPYNVHILLAHIASVLHRTYGKQETYTLTHNGLLLDVLKSKAVHGEQSVDLTKNELGILKLLMEHKGNIVSRTELMVQLWDMDEFVEDSTLTVNINRLRKKLADIGLAEYLVTKRGQGYVV